MKTKFKFILAVSFALMIVKTSLFAEVDFAQTIAPIVFEHCAECHRPNTAAPFSLLDYSSVSKRAKTMLEVMRDKFMPPWHPVKGHGNFKGERGLSAREIALFETWIEAGKPLGDESKVPVLPKFPEGWALGEPDLIVKMPRSYDVPADGPDIYRNFVIPMAIKEDLWIKAIEIMPSARAVVHHCLFYLDATGEARKLDGKNGQVGFNGDLKNMSRIGTWAVGAIARKLDGDYAYPLKKGSDLVLATHFHPSGKKETEQTTIGIHLTSEPSSRRVTELQVPGFYGQRSGLNIPAGERDFILRGSLTLPIDIELLTVGAHMHYLGTSAKGWATLPDGRVENLLYIDAWDFNWQGDYHYSQPVLLPKGTVLETEIHYDNSSDNPFNPHSPPKQVNWGLASTDEMGSLIYNIVSKNAQDDKTANRVLMSAMFAATNPKASAAINYQTVLENFDKNADRELAIAELPTRFKSFLVKRDLNKNGLVDRDEFDQMKPYHEQLRSFMK